MDIETLAAERPEALARIPVDPRVGIDQAKAAIREAGLVVIVEGVPAGLAIHPATITGDLRRRQAGYGRGQRIVAERPL